VQIGPTPWPCGHPFARLDAIQGRTEETLHLPGPAGDRIALHPLVFHGVLAMLPAGGWRVVQEADDTLRILVSPAVGEPDRAALAAQLTQALVGRGVVLPSIRVESVSALSKTAAGKMPLIQAYHPVALLPERGVDAGY
jgi:hypothetical protein